VRADIIDCLPDFVNGVGRASCETALLTDGFNALQVKQIVADVCDVGEVVSGVIQSAVGAKYLQELVELVMARLMKFGYMQFRATVGNDAALAGCDDNRNDAQRGEEMADTVAVLYVKGFEEFALIAHVDLAVGECAIDIHDEKMYVPGMHVVEDLLYYAILMDSFTKKQVDSHFFTNNKYTLHME